MPPDPGDFPWTVQPWQPPAEGAGKAMPPAPADFKLEQAPSGPTAQLAGDWTAESLGQAGDRLAELLIHTNAVTLDLSHIGRCDTAGALAVVRAIEGCKTAGTLRAKPDLVRLLDLVHNATQAEPGPPHRRRGFMDLVERIGAGVIHLGIDFYETLIFVGHTLTAAGRSLADPRKIRWAPLVALCERAGLDALPIVATTTFFIGCVLGFLAVSILAEFGASVFAVETIAFGVLREFGIVITAVLLAGRSASAFAAEIGSMKMNQEIDAMQVIGVDPYEALVFPRFAALLITVPLLTLVATLAGLFGGLVVVWSTLGLGPAFFLRGIVDNVGIAHFWVAVSKAPVMAAVIAGIGCRQGMEVGGDVDSLGRRVTTAVVHSIFSIILIDAIFALIYMELDV
jgi:phospholipid/cholesterol/gamma-HCH transport system permease protein